MDAIRGILRSSFHNVYRRLRGSFRKKKLLPGCTRVVGSIWASGVYELLPQVGPLQCYRILSFFMNFEDKDRNQWKCSKILQNRRTTAFPSCTIRVEGLLHLCHTLLKALTFRPFDLKLAFHSHTIVLGRRVFNFCVQCQVLLGWIFEQKTSTVVKSSSQTTWNCGPVHIFL